VTASYEIARRARALARRAEPMTVEPIVSLDEAPSLRPDGELPEERLQAMAALCRAAWLASGRAMPEGGRAHRADMPGEVFTIDHDQTRQPT
jgi:hypothetical protein